MNDKESKPGDPLGKKMSKKSHSGGLRSDTVARTTNMWAVLDDCSTEPCPKKARKAKKRRRSPPAFHPVYLEASSCSDEKEGFYSSLLVESQ